MFLTTVGTFAEIFFKKDEGINLRKAKVIELLNSSRKIVFKNLDSHHLYINPRYISFNDFF